MLQRFFILGRQWYKSTRNCLISDLLFWMFFRSFNKFRIIFIEISVLEATWLSGYEYLKYPFLYQENKKKYKTILQEEKIALKLEITNL